ncbi:AraC family transcriptional regulator [Ramlibacter sp.]|uniref:AraC family transcriptional regulator n=1 Tax=Ramlibacter sp. TaxID=1917967 RepID=UPI002C325E1D|nr:AraC family transcriptional regulator [Ramlibacter sp.]HWI84653.1 AraC family transcriptional regulator [Ramlibacter sp.]
MQRTSSCTWVTGILEMFAAQGIEVPLLVRLAGIDPRRLECPEERFGADEVSRLWELAVARSGDPALGLDRQLTAKYVNFDVVGYAMLSSPDLRTGLERLARYMAVVSDAATFELLREGDQHWLVLGGSGYARPVPRQRYAYGLLSLVTLCQWLTRRDVQPLAVEFKFEAPPELERYRREFRCPVRFGQPENRLRLAPADLQAPIPSRNPSLLQLHEQVLRDRLARLHGARTSHRVSQEIVRRLARGEPRREEIAASLALADRTLQRRLRAEHTSFQQLLDDARRELACQYLAEERYTLHQVAGQLGFVDQSNFFRACRRWFGEPPGQYRRRVVKSAEPALL